MWAWSTTCLSPQMGTLDEFGVVECGLDDMLGHVTDVLDHLTNQKVQHLFLIRGSPRSVNSYCKREVLRPTFVRLAFENLVELTLSFSCMLG